MQLALGIVGTVVGSFFGFPQLGFILGSAVGGAIETSRQRIEGPRINDLKVQASQYGGMVPVGFGTGRVSGNVIYCTNLREVSKTQRQGKGGGPKMTTYSYNVDIAIALSEGVMYGVRKVWANSKLIYDASTGADPEAMIASSLNAASFTFYAGTTDQLPDPTIEAVIGVGRTPAYRGTCYVVFAELDCPNGQIPQLAFELIAEGQTTTLSPIYSTVPSDGISETRATIIKSGGVQYRYTDLDASAVPTHTFGPSWHGAMRRIDMAIPSVGNLPVPTPTQGGHFAIASDINLLPSDQWSVVYFNLVDGSLNALATYVPGTADNKLLPVYAAYDRVAEKFAVVGSLTSGTSDRAYRISVLPANVLTDPLLVATPPVAMFDNVVYACDVVAGVTVLKMFDGDSGALTGTIAATANYDRPSICVTEEGIFAADLSVGGIGVNRNFWRITEADGWELLTSTGHLNNTGGQALTFFANERFAIVGPEPTSPSSDDVQYRIINYGAMEGIDPTVASIIQRISTDAGLTVGELDTSEVDDTVHGYYLTRVTAARANLDAMLRGFFIDPVESDGKLKFKPRATQTLAAEIPWEDLAAAEFGSDPPDPFPLTRMQEAELPRSATVNYINQDADYQTGAETQRRQIVDTVHEVVDEFPVATTPDKAATVAAVWLYNAWVARDGRSFKVTRKWAALDPADLVAIESPPGTFTVVRLTKVTDTGLLLECECEPADQELYTAQATGSTGPGGQTVDGLPGPTEVVPLDIPELRDADNNAGPYVAMMGYSPSWRGAELSMGPSLAELTPVGRVSNETVIAVVQDAIPAWSLNVPDETSVLVVEVQDGDSLNSITHAQLVSGELNVAAIGDDGRWELIKFRTATDLGGNMWRLTGLLRGVRGTEWATGLHEDGDVFVLLQVGGILRPVQSLADLGQPFIYQAVSIGQDPDEATTVTFTNNGVSLKPLSPVNVRVDVAGNSLTVDADRRTRARDNWLAGTVPLFEASEAWEIDVESPTGGITTYEADNLPVTIEVASFQPLDLDASADFAGADWAVQNGAFIYALSGTRVVKMNAADLSPVASLVVSSGMLQMVTGGGFLWVVDFGNPGGGTFPKIYKIDPATMTLSGSAHTLPALGDGNSIVYAAGSLWAALRYSNVVRRLNPASFATVADVAVTAPSALATDGTYVYASSLDGPPHVTHKIDPGSNTSVLTFPARATVPRDIAAAGGWLWINGADGLVAYNTTSALPVAMDFDVQGSMAALGDTLVFYTATTGQPMSVAVVDATGPDLMAVFDVAVPTGTLGARSVGVLSDDLLIVADGTTVDLYERGAVLPGTIVSVYQMSASVGRGYPGIKVIT